MSVFIERAFWSSLAERAIKTAAQTAVALIGTDAVGILSLDWAQIGGVSATATVVSILTSIGSTATGPTASLVNSERLDVPTLDYGDWSDADAEEVETDDLEWLAENEIDETPVPDDYQPKH